MEDTLQETLKADRTAEIAKLKIECYDLSMEVRFLQNHAQEKVQEIQKKEQRISELTHANNGRG